MDGTRSSGRRRYLCEVRHDAGINCCYAEDGGVKKEYRRVLGGVQAPKSSIALRNTSSRCGQDFKERGTEHLYDRNIRW